MNGIEPEVLDSVEVEAVLSADEERDGGATRRSPDAGALVPHGGTFDGQVAIVGPTRIEGRVRGSVRGRGDLRVGSGARIEGRVECDALESDGEIQGPVAVRARARFGPGARLDGDLEAPIVAFDEDAIWNGRAVVGGSNAQTPVAADPGE